MSEISILNKIAIPADEWDRMYADNVELATAIYYLLLVEEVGGFGKAFEPRSTSEVNSEVAKKMGYSVATLTAKRRQWTKDGILSDARAFLAPIRLEQQQVMADLVMSNYSAIMQQFLKVAVDPSSDVYARTSAWKTLKADVLAPALSNAKAQDEGDTEYLEKVKSLEEPEVDDAEDYISKNGG